MAEDGEAGGEKLKLETGNWKMVVADDGVEGCELRVVSYELRACLALQRVRP
jgi:hypothetical protein